MSTLHLNSRVPCPLCRADLPPIDLIEHMYADHVHEQWEINLLFSSPNRFSCPSCGGTHFGRAVVSIDPVVLSPVFECHDENGEKCKWRGEWPIKK